MALVDLFDKYGCDKGNIKHNYERVYDPAIEKYKATGKPFRLLEIGVFKGNSTEAWIEYCPEIEIVCLDIYERVQMNDVEILKHPRVTGYKGDSLKGPGDDFQALVKDGFDIIIDDGLHTHEAQRKTFLNFIPFLKDDGVYFIEDVWPYDIMTDKEKQHPWLKKYAPGFSEHEYARLLDVLDPYKLKYHDLREGSDPDTVIFEVRK